MKTIYAIRDRIAQDLAGLHMYTLFVMRTDAEAVRYFGDCLLDPKSALAHHPGDYELIKLADVTNDGHLETLFEDPVIVITGDALIAATTQHQPKLVKES